MRCLNRGYDHKDYTELLCEIKNENEQNIKYAVKESQEKRYKSGVSSSQTANNNKKRKLLLNNKMMYAYSTDDMILHDRSCGCIDAISDEKFEMISYYTDEMKWCDKCYRKAIIRKGIGYDRKEINEYVKFFNYLKVPDIELHTLIIDNNASINLIDKKTMHIHVNEDTWKVVCDNTGNHLWHNNYEVSEKGDTRTIVSGFHRQTVYGSRSFHDFVYIMVGYCWNKHNEAKFKKEENRKKSENEINLHKERETLKLAIDFIKNNPNGDFINSEEYLNLNNSFNEEQISEIIKGIRQDLSFKQILLFANNKFDHRQMAQIRSGCFLHLGKDKVKSYANPEYSAKRMRAIKFKYLLELVPRRVIKFFYYYIKRRVCCMNNVNKNIKENTGEES